MPPIDIKLPRLLLALALACGALAPHATAAPPAAAAAKVAMPTASAQPVIVTQLHWDGESLVVGTDRPLRYRSFNLREPDRVVIDLFDAELGDPTMSRVLNIDRDPIRQIRLGAHPDEGFLRVVIDGDRPLPVQISQPRGALKLVIRPQGPAEEAPAAVEEAEEASEKKASPEPRAPKRRMSPVKLAEAPFMGPPESYGPPASLAAAPAEKARKASRLATKLQDAARQDAKRQDAVRRAPTRREAPLQEAKRAMPAPVQEARAGRSATPAPDRETVGIRLSQSGGSTLLKLQGARTLHLKVHQAADPARVIVQVPAGALKGKLPAAKGQVEALDVREEGENWLLEARLPEGPVDVQHRMEDGGKTLVVAIRRQALALSRRPLVLIDPGHGGDDPGALGAGGTRESEVNLAIALKLRDALRGRGVNAALTRTGDVNMDLDSRMRLVNQLGAQVLVSVHANSHDAAHAAGLETYYRTAISQPFAQQIHQVLVAELQRPDRGVREARLFMLRHPTIPSALIEAGFISNPEEERLLGDGEYQRKAAEAIAKGVASYLSTPVAELSE